MKLEHGMALARAGLLGEFGTEGVLTVREAAPNELLRGTMAHAEVMPSAPRRSFRVRGGAVVRLTTLLSELLELARRVEAILGVRLRCVLLPGRAGLARFVFAAGDWPTLAFNNAIAFKHRGIERVDLSDISLPYATAWLRCRLDAAAPAHLDEAILELHPLGPKLAD